MKAMRLGIIAYALFVTTGTAFAEPFSIRSGWSQGVHVHGSGGPQTVVLSGPAVVEPQEMAISNVFKPFPAVPAATLTATSVLSGAAVYDLARGTELHGFAQSFVDIDNNAGNGFLGGNAFANFGFVVQDEFDFASDLLPVGTPVAFRLSGTFHSVLDATAAGDCSRPIGLGYSPTGMATLTTTGGGGFPLFDAAIHDTCGRGSELMTFGGILASTVGGTFRFQTTLELNSSASLLTNAHATALTIVDASSTARLFVEILTPNVVFSAASGSSYALPQAPVPEPSFLLLSGVGIGSCIWSGRGRRSDSRRRRRAQGNQKRAKVLTPDSRQ